MSNYLHLTLAIAQRPTLNEHQKRWLGFRVSDWQHRRALRAESGYVLARRLSCEMARIWGLYPTIRERQYEGGRRAYLLAFERTSQVFACNTRLNNASNVLF
jgi:hypothetical protein